MIKNHYDFLEDSTDRGHVVGTWGFHSHMDFTRMRSEETNVWFFEQIFNFLRSFFGLVLPDSLEIITYNATQRIEKKGIGSNDLFGRAHADHEEIERTHVDSSPEPECHRLPQNSP